MDIFRGGGEKRETSATERRCKKAQRDARATVKRCTARKDALERRRGEAEAAAKKHARDASGLKAAHDAAAAELSTRSAACEAHAATAPGDAVALAETAATSSAAARGAAAAAAKIEAQLRARLRFDYEDPGGKLAPRVKGVLAGLVTPSGKDVAAALEVVAGGKLYQVVVDDAATGKALLERGKLRRRVTLVPLDKVRASRIDAGRLDRAAKVAKKRGGDARVALEFVGYDAEVAAAVESGGRAESRRTGPLQECRRRGWGRGPAAGCRVDIPRDDATPQNHRKTVSPVSRRARSPPGTRSAPRWSATRWRPRARSRSTPRSRSAA